MIYAIMSISIETYKFGGKWDEEIPKILFKAFVDGGYSSHEHALKTFSIEKLTRRGTPIVAVDRKGQKIHGFVMLVDSSSPDSQIADSNESEVHLFAVDPVYRRQGIGSSLLRKCFSLSLSLGFSNIILSTQPTQTDAHQVYESLGFIRQPERDWPRPAGGTYCVYKKIL